MIFQRVLLLTLYLSAVQLYSQPTSKTTKDSLTKILYQYVSDDSPGMAVGVVKEGKVVYEQYLGYSNLSHNLKIDEKTRFNIASTAKQFTALMILQLSLEKKLSLEDDIRKYLPTLYPKVKKEIKIRHLLNHTSGIRDYIFLLDLKNKPYWKQIGLDNGDIIELLEKQEELAFKPGSTYTYSNSGYNVLAKIIEKVSGDKFYAYSKRFFEEMGMNETTFIKAYMNVIPNRADPYSDWGGGIWKEFPTVTKTQGEGFLYTTLKDQLIYEEAVQNAKLNRNTSLVKSQEPIPNSEITSYGFGLELDNRLGRPARHHSGSTVSYHSQTIRFPDEKLSVFVMSNNGNIWSGTIADEIASVFLPEKELIKEDEYNSRLSKNQKNIEKQQVLGQYRSSKGSLIRIVEEEGKLFWKKGNTSPIEIILENRNVYSASYDPKLKIVFYEKEMVAYYPSGKTDIYKRSPELPASLNDLEGFVGIYNSTELEMNFELKLTDDHKLMTSFSNRIKEREVEVLNRNELLVDKFTMKVQRDQFDRVTEILLSINRAENNRFRKKTNIIFQPKIETENGSIQVTTIGSIQGESSDILLTKNYLNGNEIWSKQFGGSSYDQANSILATEDGYVIIGSTSSYGKGNYDIFVIKTDKEGNKLWQNTYGGFYNEYGYAAEVTKDGYLVKGSKQYCTSNSDVFNRECTTNVWFVYIDKEGKEVSNEILEEYILKDQ